MFKFHKGYFCAMLILFVIEVLIALYVRDNFIRPYFGDVLVVILIYCFVKSFFDLPYFATAIGVLLFSFFVEWTQYMNFIGVIGLEKNRLARTVLGNSFAWHDIIAYSAGAVAIILFEKYLNPHNSLNTLK